MMRVHHCSLYGKQHSVKENLWNFNAFPVHTAFLDCVHAEVLEYYENCKTYNVPLNNLCVDIEIKIVLCVQIGIV